MSDLEAIADRVEIEALRGEFTDAAMMRDYDRLTSLFTPGGALQIPDASVELAGREEIRAWGERVPAVVDYLVQTAHPGTIQLDGDTASGRAYICELIRLRDGSSHLNYGIYHDRYQRTGDGWKFTERVYEIRYLDTTALASAAPQSAGPPADEPGPFSTVPSSEPRGGSTASPGCEAVSADHAIAVGHLDEGQEPLHVIEV